MTQNVTLKMEQPTQEVKRILPPEKPEAIVLPKSRKTLAKAKSLNSVPVQAPRD